MGEAIQHCLALGDLSDGTAVVLLVQEKAGLLAVDVVYGIFDAVFGDDYGAELVTLCGGAGGLVGLGAKP